MEDIILNIIDVSFDIMAFSIKTSYLAKDITSYIYENTDFKGLIQSNKTITNYKEIKEEDFEIIPQYTFEFLKDFVVLYEGGGEAIEL